MKRKKKPTKIEKAIFTISIIICMLLICLVYYVCINNKKIDCSNYSPRELIDFFQNNEYEIEVSQYKYIYTTTYITLRSERNGISVQRIHDDIVGNLMTFRDKSINDESADLLDLNKNDTRNELQQYKAYENWLKKYNITQYQVSNMLEYYYKYYDYEIENMNELLKKLNID